MSIISVVQHAASSVSLSLFRPPFLSSPPYYEMFPPCAVNGERERERETASRWEGSRRSAAGRRRNEWGETMTMNGGSSGEHVRLARMGEQCKQRMDGWVDGGRDGMCV